MIEKKRRVDQSSYLQVRLSDLLGQAADKQLAVVLADSVLGHGCGASFFLTDNNPAITRDCCDSELKHKYGELGQNVGLAGSAGGPGTRGRWRWARPYLKSVCGVRRFSRAKQEFFQLLQKTGVFSSR